MSSAPLLPKNNTYHKRTNSEIKPNRTTPPPPLNNVSPISQQHSALRNSQNHHSSAAQLQTENPSKNHISSIIFSEHKKLLDLCLQNNAFKDCQILCEKIINKFNQKYIPLASDEAKCQKKLYAYAIYSMARSFYLKGHTNQAKLIFEQYNFSDSINYPEYTLQFAQCYYDLSKFTKVQGVLLGQGLHRQSNDSTFLISELKTKFDDDQLPFALRLLALSHLKLSNNSLAQELFSEALHLFPFLWTSIESYFSTFTREQISNNKPQLSLFDYDLRYDQTIASLVENEEFSEQVDFKSDQGENDENKPPPPWLRDSQFHGGIRHEYIPISEHVKSTSTTSLGNLQQQVPASIENIDSDQAKETQNQRQRRSPKTGQKSHQSQQKTTLKTAQISQNSQFSQNSQNKNSQNKISQHVSQSYDILKNVYKEYCQYFHCLSNTLLLHQKLDYEECIRSSYATSAALTSISYRLRGLSAYNLQRYEQSIDILLQYRGDYTFLTEGCDYLSSALWHLKKRKQLAVLSRELKETNCYSVEAWVSLGNLLSLEKHRSQSIQAFQRSVELAVPPGLYPDLNVNNIVSRWAGGFDVSDGKKLSYCLCLLGHEMLEYSDLDGALKCYSHAILADKYLYQAYYGIGTIYMQKEINNTAEKYFEYAVNLHPNSAMIYVSLAQSQVNQGKIRPACDILTHACKLDPSNTQCKYYLARNLMLARDFVGALQIAEEVKLLAPKEPSIYELLSRIYDQLGRKVKAITCGNLAVAYGKGIYGANTDDLGVQDDTLLSNDYDNSSNFESGLINGNEGGSSFETPEVASRMMPSRLNFGIGNPGTSLSTPTVRNPLNIGNPIIGDPTIPMTGMNSEAIINVNSGSAITGLNSGNLNFTPVASQIPSSNNNQSQDGQQGLQFIQLNQNSATNDYQVPSYLRDEVEQDVLTMEYS